FPRPGLGGARRSPTIAAAAYPQVVALARLLISPSWGALAVGFSPVEHSLFAREIHTTVAPGYQWPPPRFSKDPLHRCIIGGNREAAFDARGGGFTDHVLG